jgi:hypothetical protein
VEPERRLTLSFGMRAPGAGVLEFEVEPLQGEAAAPGSPPPPTGTRPGSGVSCTGYSMEPAHRVIFKGLTREIARRAEALGHGSNQSVRPPTSG